jgi:hypothetical protein
VGLRPRNRDLAVALKKEVDAPLRNSLIKSFLLFLAISATTYHNLFSLSTFLPFCLFAFLQ